MGASQSEKMDPEKDLLLLNCSLGKHFCLPKRGLGLRGGLRPLVPRGNVFGGFDDLDTQSQPLHCQVKEGTARLPECGTVPPSPASCTHQPGKGPPKSCLGPGAGGPASLQGQQNPRFIKIPPAMRGHVRLCPPLHRRVMLLSGESTHTPHSSRQPGRMGGDHLTRPANQRPVPT